jgi:hypothetical protein
MEIEESKQSVVRIFHQILEAYQLTPVLKIHFTRNFCTSLHGFVSLEAAGFFKLGVSIDRSFDMIIENHLALLNNFSRKGKKNR